ncbi:MAG: formylglycine-generating enzyme family protein [Byssovorax sp.]
MTLSRRHPLSDGLPEPWAAEWGEDRHGVFVGFAVGEVVQRLRWVPPGKFLMGSPEEQAGREENEGPQHEVELSDGFWLADTPCTQALWRAVIGSNPSQFGSPDRPVERVSWDDCKEFLERLGLLVPGLGARLPTEAEWEYACRAGTTTATWVGDLDIKGLNNASPLDAIAWYGGNSGHGFELKQGYDSSYWPEKRYQHTKAGSRPVRGKQPNPLGLHDMLGNVYEWCEDRYGEYNATTAMDPRGPDVGSNRVFRGGSWSSQAGYVRAASHLGGDPSLRAAYLGFRLARSQPRNPPR